MNPFNSNQKGKIFTYSEYIKWVDELVESNATSGEDQSEARIGFTFLNQKRMSRINKTLKLNPEVLQKLEVISNHQEWWVITEAWCGDSAQILPVLARIADASDGKVSLKIILRDENPELMDNYLTNGGKAIPKMIAFEGEKEIFEFGPRPKPAADLAKEWKTNPQGRSHEDFEKDLHTWYAKDKSQSIQQEILELLF